MCWDSWYLKILSPRYSLGQEVWQCTYCVLASRVTLQEFSGESLEITLQYQWRGGVRGQRGDSVTGPFSILLGSAQLWTLLFIWRGAVTDWCVQTRAPGRQGVLLEHISSLRKHMALSVKGISVIIFGYRGHHKSFSRLRPLLHNTGTNVYLIGWQGGHRGVMHAGAWHPIKPQ